MRGRPRAFAILVFCAVAAAARADDLQLAAATLLYESGQAAPAIELRSIAEDGAVWRAAINGWALSLARERPLERGRRLILDVTATPYDAHNSRRIYRDGERAEELEFDDAALVPCVAGYASVRDQGVTLNAGADYALTRSLEVGVRGGTFRGQSLRATGAMVVLTARTRGLRIVAGAGRSDERTTVMVTAGGGMFRR